MFNFRIIALMLTVCPLFLFSQERRVGGHLKTKDGKAVAYANVVLKGKEDRIITFKTSDADGNFMFSIPDSLDIESIMLEVRLLGYKTVRLPIKAHIFQSITLEEQAINLAEVKVRSRPQVTHHGDTIIYNVASFAKNEDRSIGDVLKRMPGIEVGENGEIKYNGKSISHFYIDGDDLLSDRYAIGSKTIPQGMVKNVEIMQNHQPIKVLQHKMPSEQVALNLTIKEEAKLKMTGQAKIGVGLPQQYDGEVNSILFNKKYKMLNVLKGNNIGEDLSSDFTAFNRSSALSALGNEHPDALLSTGTASMPALPTERYYFNRSGSVNANNLIHLKSGWQLKSIVQVWLDRSRLHYNSLNDLYLEQDTVHYSEQQNLIRYPFMMDFTLSAEANKKGYYLKDELRFSYSKNKTEAELLSNQLISNLKLKDKIRDFSNRLEYVPELKNKDILRFDWYSNYYSRPQWLTIQPGVHTDVLNDSLNYAATFQATHIPTWFNRLSLTYGLIKGIVKQQYTIGVLNEVQQLESALRLQQENGVESTFNESFDNRLKWNRHQLYTEANYAYKNGRLESTASLPLINQWINYRDPHLDFSGAQYRLLFNPSLQLKWTVNTEDYISANYAYRNQIGNINGIYSGLILTNYRTIQSNDADLQEKHSRNLGIQYHFQRSVMLLFMNIDLNWNKARANSMASSVVNNNISQTVLLPLHNNINTLEAHAEVSKYVFALGAVAKIRASWNTTRYNQIINQELLPYNNISFSLSPDIEARLWNLIAFQYRTTLTWISSKIVAKESAVALPSTHIRQYNQLAKLTCTPYKNLFISLSGNYQLTRQQQDLRYLFIDANFRLRLHRDSDLELNLTNLTNIKDYESYSLSANSFWYSRYALLGRMAVVKYTFNF